MSDSNEATTSKEGDDSTITMVDVLECEKDLEEHYAAVLGASDEKCCNFAQGPVKRQALYSCLTCLPEARDDLEKCAGICLACSYRCHDKHELVELYTKRNFRCDCPTEIFGGNRCALNPNIELPQPRNLGNAYNQNFQGLYCTCHRPFPDPESAVEEEMVQCVICEDWFHLHHLEMATVSSQLVDASHDTICGGCMQKHAFLIDYTGLCLNPVENAEDSETNISATSESSNEEDRKLRSDLDKSISEIMNMPIEPEPTSSRKKKKKSNAKPDEPAAKRAKPDDGDTEWEGDCRRPTGGIFYQKGATFWGADWRASLCQCAKCMEMYKMEKVDFLLDTEDSTEEYERRGKKRAAGEKSTYERGIRALASLGRVQQIDAIYEYNRMKDRLKEFLHSFAVNKQIVTEEDINRFFTEIRNERNAKVGQPYLCR